MLVKLLAGAFLLGSASAVCTESVEMKLAANYADSASAWFDGNNWVAKHTPRASDTITLEGGVTASLNNKEQVQSLRISGAVLKIGASGVLIVGGACVETCTAPCQNSGVCTDPDKCVCPYGFGGADCSSSVPTTATPSASPSMRPTTKIPTTKIPTTAPPTTAPPTAQAVAPTAKATEGAGIAVKLRPADESAELTDEDKQAMEDEMRFYLLGMGMEVPSDTMFAWTSVADGSYEMVMYFEVEAEIEIEDFAVSPDNGFFREATVEKMFTCNGVKQKNPCAVSAPVKEEPAAFNPIYLAGLAALIPLAVLVVYKMKKKAKVGTKAGETAPILSQIDSKGSRGGSRGGTPNVEIERLSSASRNARSIPVVI